MIQMYELFSIFVYFVNKIHISFQIMWCLHYSIAYQHYCDVFVSASVAKLFLKDIFLAPHF